MCDVLNRPGRSILLGDLNAHNTLWGPPTRASTTEGRTLADQLTEVQNYIVLNEPVATHTNRGGLDLAIVHARLAPRATWSLHPTLVSDHFGIQVDLIDSEPEFPPDFVSRWPSQGPTGTSTGKSWPNRQLWTPTPIRSRERQTNWSRTSPLPRTWLSPSPKPAIFGKNTGFPITR